MSEEIKINMPLFDINEEAELEYELSFHLEEFTNEIMRTMSKEKDIIILKKVIEKQQKEIEELKSQLDFIDEQNRYIDKLEKEIEELNSEFAINTEIHKRDIRIKELEEVNNCLHETLLGGKDE